MPSKDPALITLRGEAAYARALDRLVKTLRAQGVRISNRSQLADYALTVLGLQHGVKLPPRVMPVGSNQHGPPSPR